MLPFFRRDLSYSDTLYVSTRYQRGNRSVDPRCSRLCIVESIVHTSTYTFAIPCHYLDARGLCHSQGGTSCHGRSCRRLVRSWAMRERDIPRCRDTVMRKSKTIPRRRLSEVPCKISMVDCSADFSRIKRFPQDCTGRHDVRQRHVDKSGVLRKKSQTFQRSK